MGAYRVVKETTIINITIVPDPDSNNHGVEIYTVRRRIANERHIDSVTNKPRSDPATEGSSFFESCFLSGEVQTQDSKTHEEGDCHQSSGGEHWQSCCGLG